MTVNFEILAKAIWEVLKIPLTVIGIVVGIVSYFVILVKLFGSFDYAMITLVLTAAIFVLGMFVADKYRTLMKNYQEEQKRLWDTLKR